MFKTTLTMWTRTKPDVGRAEDPSDTIRRIDDEYDPILISGPAVELVDDPSSDPEDGWLLDATQASRSQRRTRKGRSRRRKRLRRLLIAPLSLGSHCEEQDPAFGIRDEEVVSEPKSPGKTGDLGDLVRKGISSGEFRPLTVSCSLVRFRWCNPAFPSLFVPPRIGLCRGVR